MNTNENEKGNMVEKYGIKAVTKDEILPLFKIQLSIPFINFNNQIGYLTNNEQMER